MTLKETLKPLSSVSLEDLIWIMNMPHPSKELDGLVKKNHDTFEGDSIWISVSALGIMYRWKDAQGFLDKRPSKISYQCYLRANNLGYYVPGLSEELKIKELEGEKKHCFLTRRIEIEKQIEELKQTK